MNGHLLSVDFLESILYCDCELLFAAVDAGRQRYIAVHRYGCEYAVAPVSGYDLAAFQAGKIGLRSLLLSHPSGEWYTARLGADAGPIVLVGQPNPINAGCANLLDGDYFVSATAHHTVQPPATTLTQV